MHKRTLVLASASPRRKQLLSYLTDHFHVASADIDESNIAGESAYELVNRLARSKAEAILEQHQQAFVLGSDTVVAMADKLLGKPRDESDFRAMMSMLSDNWHQVYTGVALVSSEQKHQVVVKTEVKFCSISQQEMRAYWQSKEPQDKAGGYAIQGRGAQFVEQIRGSVSAVVGLPLVETKQLLKHVGIVE